MPTYIVKYSNLTFSKKQKKKIAEGITKVHSSVTGADTYFAQVIFEANKKNSHFIGGKSMTSKEIFLNGQIRNGRTQSTKKKLMLRLKENLLKETNLKNDNIWIYLEELSSKQMIEFGEILPKSGQEKKWFNSLSPTLKKKLKRI